MLGGVSAARSGSENLRWREQKVKESQGPSWNFNTEAKKHEQGRELHAQTRQDKLMTRERKMTTEEQDLPKQIERRSTTSGNSTTKLYNPQ